MLQNLKQRLIDYADAFTTYDYAAFGWLIFLLLILIVLAITLSKRKPKFASFLIFLVLILMFSAPVAIKIFLDKTIRKVSIVDQNHTKLNFSKVLVVTGTVKNEGKVDLNKCYLSTKVLKLTGNHYLDLLHQVKPLRKRTIILDENISQNKMKEFKVVFEQFNYAKDYNVSIDVECY